MNKKNTDQKLTILVVDDSKSILEILAAELTTLGYTVFTADSAEAAQEIIEETPVDILFLDLILPGLNGVEYLQKVESQKRNIIPIIMTAYESTESAVEAIEKGAYDYVFKPIEPAHLEIIIKRALKRFEIDQDRKINIQKRIQALESFVETTHKTNELIQDLKLEVNKLLLDSGKSPKYDIQK